MALHTIAHRDRAAEAATQCSDSPARPVSGLVSSTSDQLADRTFPRHATQWLRSDLLTDLPLRGQCRP